MKQKTLPKYLNSAGDCYSKLFFMLYYRLPMKFNLKFLIILLISWLAGGLFGVNSAQALDFTPPEIKDDSYQAQYISQSVADPITIEAGATKEVIVKFKNAGSKTWNSAGYNYVSAYTVNDKYRSSQFASAGWLAKSQPAKLSQTTQSGAIGEFKIKLTAPAKAGDYQEDFYLAVENVTWLKGGYFYLRIKVAPAAVSSPSNFRFTSEMELGDRGTQVEELQKMLTKSGHYTYGQITGYYGPVTQQAVKKYQKDNNIYPQTGLIGPLTLGTLNKSFTATTSTVFLAATTTPSEQPAQNAVLKTRELIKEPDIKVGLYALTGEAVFTSPHPYMVYAQKDYQVLLPPNTAARLSYVDGKYIFSSAVFSFASDKNLRLVASEPDYYFTLSNYTRGLSYRPGKNYNSYRGNLEIKYVAAKKSAYVINELPLDLYVAGVDETGNDSPPQYIKALLTAARTYAYVKIDKIKSVYNRGFDVYPSTVDQLYLGYNSEKELPNMPKYAKETAGEMVTYQSQPVTTPYFGHSDGYTRSWSAAWGGTDKPWLKKVEAVYDHGQSMYGHGVGMSNRDASLRALKDGWDYVKILQYYYTGVEVEKIY